MDDKYIIILLFIFLVFLMGSINSTVTNNFYNNTTGSQDHAVLTNLSYADSNHIGFQSSDTLDNDIEALGYVTNSTMAHDNEKVNKSGDTITGNIYFNTTANGTIFDMYDGGVERTKLIGSGVQWWHLYSSIGGGWIYYATPGGWAGIALFNDTLKERVDLRTQPDGFGFYSFNSTESVTTAMPVLLLTRDHEIKLNYSYKGPGNAYTCVDSTGKLYRGSPTC